MDFQYFDIVSRMKPTVRIHDWTLMHVLSHRCLLGVPEDHPGQLVSNMKLIRTSPIIYLNIEQGIAETENTVYNLIGEMATPQRITELCNEVFRTPRLNTRLQ